MQRARTGRRVAVMASLCGVLSFAVLAAGCAGTSNSFDVADSVAAGFSNALTHLAEAWLLRLVI